MRIVKCEILVIDDSDEDYYQNIDLLNELGIDKKEDLEYVIGGINFDDYSFHWFSDKGDYVIHFKNGQRMTIKSNDELKELINKSTLPHGS